MTGNGTVFCKFRYFYDTFSAWFHTAHGLTGYYMLAAVFVEHIPAGRYSAQHSPRQKEGNKCKKKNH